MLIRILIGVAAVLVLFAAVVATRRSAYHVERSVDIAAPPDLVFGFLNDLHHFASVLVLFGSPLETVDPGMQKTFAGPASGVGQSYAWSGKEAGTSRMTIEESVPGEKVRITLEFVKPMASTSTCTLTLAGAPTGSFVTWSMDGNHNFLGKALGVLMNMDKMLGSDIEKGLARLKTAEGAARSAAVTPVQEKKE